MATRLQDKDRQMELLTWHGKPELKAAVVSGYDAHIAADSLIKGQYFNEDGGEFRGCHIGCVVHDLGGDHESQYAKLTGIPEWLMDLNEHFFENLPNRRNQILTREILDAIPVGVDITRAYHEFMIWLLTDETHGAIQYCEENGVAATNTVAALHIKAARGESVAESEWAAAGVAARAAARAAVGAAAWVAVGAAAGDAARAARAAARAAAGAAAGDAQAKALANILRNFK